MSMPTGWMIAIIAVLIILLFGAPKLPKLAKSMGQSMRIFNSEVKTMRTEREKNADSSQDDEEKDEEAVEGRVISPEKQKQSGTQGRTGAESYDEHR
ncbi:sec-independent protein translocase protein TatA [Nesterenkonia lacusekhoensis]|uniref:Sec-independent protein translocase protein TatA n=2 Tax=Nesterenkonia lacusekhoensis TaxID=150832 RepID=A0ABS4T1D4_9MICC|nr:sec-independent protein translocase protein TatA [Nesterenkonia lacusekhoensis]